ncbi:MAG: C39 family peptidase, partial [Anaerolineaceae bacterium]|nr:C39 family peptidase [Anaerolineaceae bacterium]
HNGPSLKEKVGAFLAGICVGLILLAFALFQVPEIRDRVQWRIEIASAFLRGVIDPVKTLPTAVISSINADQGETSVLLSNVSQAVPTMTETQTPLPVSTLVATATVTPTPQPTYTPTLLPTSFKLVPPAYEKQDINNCGPATLSMHLGYYGWQGNQKTISSLIKPKQDDRNVNVEELVSYVNTEAAAYEIIYRVGGDIELMKKLIAAGFPVTIEEAFHMQESYWFSDDRWAGHYLLLTGYDDASQVFISQDVYVSPNLSVSYKTLDKNWQAFNRVYVLIYPPEQRPQVQAILGDQWDAKVNRQHALDFAKQETEKDSTDSFAWFNLGTNLVYFEKYSQAANAYDNARGAGLPQRMLRYQFGPFFAYFNTGRIEDLLLLTDYALKRTPNSEEAMLWRAWGMYRQGDKTEAEKLFLRALNAKPGYTDAQYGLDFVRNN